MVCTCTYTLTMDENIITATVKATGRVVKVYRLKTGGWGLYEDGGKTTFKDSELTDWKGVKS